MTHPHRCLTAITAALVLGALAAAFPAAAADPFYESLLLKGSTEIAAGDNAAAVETLRLACFGLLDQPATLANCLAHLAVAQAAIGDTDGFQETFRRVVEVEHRFGGYSDAELTPELKASFEDALQRNINETTLVETEVFAYLVPSPEERLQSLSPQQRKNQLEQLAAVEPDNPEPQIALARLDLANGKERKARRRLEAALADDPQNAEANMLLGTIEARREHWAQAAAHLETSATTAADPEAAAALIESLLALGRTDKAVAFADTLSAEITDDQRVAERVAQARDAAAAMTAEEEPETGVGDTAEDINELEQLAAAALAGPQDDAPLEPTHAPPEPTATATALPPPIRPTPTRPAPKAASGIESIEWQPNGNRLVVLIEADGALDQAKIRYSRLDDPPRYLFRLTNMVEPFFPYELQVPDSALLHSIRAALHPELDPAEIHVVLDLATDAAKAGRVSVTGRVLLIELE